ncbi:hypothetical protein FACS189472_11430 [Alphaproteobacteria bacterium]|nr:hypothetical protein FACS189472_11430 [Alphaproteobacteria bacterium]
MTVVQKEYLTVTSKPKYFDPTIPNYPDPDDPFPPPMPPYPPPPPSDDPPTTPPITAPDGENPIVNSNAVAKATLPMWFINAPAKYKKIIRVIGATVNQIVASEYGFLTTIEVPVQPGYRLFSNIVSNSPNVMISTRSPSHGGANAADLQRVVGKEGFVMMVNNYNCVKEFDVTMDDLREMTFYIRTYNGHTDQRFCNYVDFVAELELMLVDESQV